MDILREIVQRRREDVARAKQYVTLREMEKRARAAPEPRDFKTAITRKHFLDTRPVVSEVEPHSSLATAVKLIAEIKRRSPSKGLIRPDFDHRQIADAYERSAASAISVLTEPNHFDGSLSHLSDARSMSTKPILRKDFLFDEYHVYESVAAGADAILLIVSILHDEQLRSLLQLASSLKLSTLVETHDAPEVERAINAGAEVIGINNRNLKDFSENLETTLKLRPLVPDGTIVVSESAIRTRDDIARLEEAGVDAILVGETLMRSANITDTISDLLQVET